MTDEEMDIEAKQAMDNWLEFGEKEIEQRTLILNHIEELKTKDYREAVEECLLECESCGELKLIDLSHIKGQRQEEKWVEFNHVYVNQTTDGGMSGDEFAGYIYIPITKKLYVKSFYSM